MLDGDQDRFLLIDGMLHTAMPHDPAEITGRCHLFTERYNLELLPYYRPAARRGLLIGLGGGLLPQVLQGYGIEMEAVEIDPVVVEFARTYFPYTGPVTVADGRWFVQQTNHRYDFAVLDAYCSDVAPVHLGTQEMFRSVGQVLRPGSILAINHVGRPQGFATACLVRTLRTVFPQVEVFAMEPEDEVQFLTVFASDAPLHLPSAPEPIWRRTHPGLRFLPSPVDGSAKHAGDGGSFLPSPASGGRVGDGGSRRVFVPLEAGEVVTDDRHPAEWDGAEVSRAWREKTRQLLGEM